MECIELEISELSEGVRLTTVHAELSAAFVSISTWYSRSLIWVRVMLGSGGRSVVVS